MSDPEIMYPSIEELFVAGGWISRPLREEIALRYAKHGPEYITEQKHVDGRPINNCMLVNSAQDAIEEVVDAAFNVLVLRLKGYAVTSMMRSLQDAYTSLLALKAFIEQEKK